MYLQREMTRKYAGLDLGFKCETKISGKICSLVLVIYSLGSEVELIPPA